MLKTIQHHTIERGTIYMRTRIQIGLMAICLLLAVLVVSCSSTRSGNSTTETVSTNDATTNTLPEEDNTPTEINVGDKGLLTKSDEITVMNPEPIDGYRYGYFGTVYKDNLIQLVAKGNEEEGLLVRYTNTAMTMSDECPTGTLFFISVEDFRLCKNREREQRKNKERIRELLKQEKVNSKK